MIEFGDTEDEYEVSVVTTAVVKRHVRVVATSEAHARALAVEATRNELKSGVDLEWSVPQKSRSDVDSDHDLLGPMMTIHHESIVGQMISGMCPKKVSGN